MATASLQEQIGSIADIPSVYAAADPERVAVEHSDGRVTYGELDCRSNRVAYGARALGIPPQSRVVLLSKNDRRFFELLFGLARADMALVPVNWRLTDEELAFIINDSEAPMVVVSQEYAQVIERLRTELPRLRHVLVFDDRDGCGNDYDAWLAYQDEASVTRAGGRNDDVLQIYTSGTTGLPKGAVLTDGNLLHYLQALALSPIAPFPPTTLVLVPLPLFHVAGCCWGLNALYHGVADIVLSDASAASIVEAFRRFPITKAGLVPAVIATLLDHPDAATLDFSRLDTLGYGGSPISPELLERVRDRLGCCLVQMFGMTESCSLATFLGAEDHDPVHPGRMLSAGKPGHGVGLRIVGPDGDMLPPGGHGEVLLSGLHIMKGYWRRPAATAEAIVDGWYRSGDIGYIDEDGYLHIRDRLKDMIISGGENVYSVEVECVLSSMGGVAEAAVIGVPDPLWGEAVKAFVICQSGHKLTENDVIAYCRTRLAGYKCPKRVDFVTVLPRNSTGKILKRSLREPDRAK